MTPSQLRLPHKYTLRKYGLSAEMWYTLGDLQEWRCPICERQFTEELRPVIEHEHVKGYRKMPIEKRPKYVRGLTCNYCNVRRLPKGSKNLSPVEISYNIYQYLLEYSLRGE